MSQYAQFSVSTLSDSNDRVAVLNRRFINYLISLNFARGQLLAEEGDEQVEVSASRELLAVEQQRRAEQARRQAAHDRVRHEVEQQLHQRLYAAVEQRLNEPHFVRDRVLCLNANAAHLLDHLFSPSSSSRKIETLAQGLDWLHVGLVKLVNLPPFASPNDLRRARITHFRNALNFVGSDDLKVIVGALSMQQWLPPAEAPFVLLRRKLWHHVMSTAVLCQRLAELDDKLDPAVAFNIGMFHEMGKVVLARLYVKIFDDVRQAMLQDLRNETTSARYNALVNIDPDQQFLRDLMLQKDTQVTQHLFADFGLARLPFTAVYEQYAQAHSVRETSGYARVLWQANTFSEFRMLHQANLATLDDGKLMFAASEIPAATVVELRKLNLKKLILARERASLAS